MVWTWDILVLNVWKSGVWDKRFEIMGVTAELPVRLKTFGIGMT